MSRGRAALLALLVAAAAALGAPGAAAAQDDLCLTSGPAPAPGPAPLRFGLTAQLAGSAGEQQLDVAPQDPVKLARALGALRPGARNGRLVVRLNRLFSADGQAGIDRFAALARSYARRGFLVESQIRYHPAKADEGDVAAFSRFARRAVRTLGRLRAVVAFDVTNEVNLAISPNTSDGAYPRALDALVAGTVAARRELDAMGRRDVSLGFTYAWRWVPGVDRDFWQGIGARSTPAFRAAVDHVGVQLYPGLFYPPVLLPGQTAGAATVDALEVLRRCMVPQARLAPDVELWITEIGYPTNLGRTETRQAQDLRTTVEAVHRVARTLGVTDLRYFNLRDNDSDGTDLFDAVGLLRDDHAPKPAFGTFRELVRRYGRR